MVEAPPYAERLHPQTNNYHGKLAEGQEECPLWAGQVVLEPYTTSWDSKVEVSNPNTAGCMCHLPVPKHMIDILGNEVRVGDTVVCCTRARDDSLRIKEVLEFKTVLRWQSSWKQPEDFVPHHTLELEAVVKGMDNRNGAAVVRITQLQCEGCGEFKHPTDLLVMCGVCDQKIPKRAGG